MSAEEKDGAARRIKPTDELRRSRRRRPRHRGGVRGSRREGRGDAARPRRCSTTTAIFASNTSTLPITSLAETYKDPEKFIGIHFFSPVDRMMLVEIIIGKKTGDAALAMALDYVRQIRKTPIVVNDSRGFYANRCVMAYLLEGHLMLAEGVPPAMIENVAKMAGMPVGPLSLTDEIGIDLAWKILQATKKDGRQGDHDRARAGEAARGAGGEARALRPQEREGLL